MPETVLCAQRGCGKPLDREGEPRWCKSCWARYQREYQVLKLDRSERKGFVMGREAMRKIIAEEFVRLQAATFRGAEIATLVLNMPGPLVSDKADAESAV